MTVAEGANSSVARSGDRTVEPAEPRRTIVATKRKDGLPITSRLDGPLMAGRPARARTRVRNVGDSPISWYLGRNGLGVGARMTEASWGTAEPPGQLPATGDPSSLELRAQLVDELAPGRNVGFGFDLKSVDGVPVESDDFHVRLKIRPGEHIGFVHEWDGHAARSRPGGPAGRRGRLGMRLQADIYSRA